MEATFNAVGLYWPGSIATIKPSCVALCNVLFAIGHGVKTLLNVALFNNRFPFIFFATKCAFAGAKQVQNKDIKNLVWYLKLSTFIKQLRSRNPSNR